MAWKVQRPGTSWTRLLRFYLAYIHFFFFLLPGHQVAFQAWGHRLFPRAVQLAINKCKANAASSPSTSRLRSKRGSEWRLASIKLIFPKGSGLVGESSSSLVFLLQKHFNNHDKYGFIYVIFLYIVPHDFLNKVQKTSWIHFKNFLYTSFFKFFSTSALSKYTQLSKLTLITS